MNNHLDQSPSGGTVIFLDLGQLVSGDWGRYGGSLTGMTTLLISAHTPPVVWHQELVLREITKGVPTRLVIKMDSEITLDQLPSRQAFWRMIARSEKSACSNRSPEPVQMMH